MQSSGEQCGSRQYHLCLTNLFPVLVSPLSSVTFHCLSVCLPGGLIGISDSAWLHRSSQCSPEEEVSIPAVIPARNRELSMIPFSCYSYTRSVSTFVCDCFPASKASTIIRPPSRGLPQYLLTQCPVSTRVPSLQSPSPHSSQRNLLKQVSYAAICLKPSNGFQLNFE